MTGSARVFWVTHALGAGVVVWAVVNLVDAPLGRPESVARFFLGGLIAHDLVLAPIVYVFGWCARRLSPTWLWPSLRNGLVATGVIALYSYPFVRGFGRREVNPSILPHDYAEGLALVIAVVWFVTAVFAVRSWRRHRKQAVRAASW